MEHFSSRRKAHELAPGEISISAIVEFFRRQWTFILPLTLLAALVGLMLAIAAPPVYRANAVVRVDGSDGNTQPASPVSGILQTKSVPTAEVEMLRTRSVVLRAVDSARLDIVAEPKRFPVIGAWLARRSREISVPGLFGMGGYAWGTESIKLGAFDVPPPFEGKPFSLVVGTDGRFTLRQGVDLQLEGLVGRELFKTTAAGDIRLFVERIDAKPGAEFSLAKTSREEAAEALIKALAVAERGKQSGMIALSLDGEDPAQIATVVNEVARQYIQQNIDFKTEEAEQSLAFLEQQLPQLRAAIDAAETKFSAFRSARGTTNIDEEVKAASQQTLQMESRLAELRQRKAELSTTHQDASRAVETINQQIKAASAEIAKINEKSKLVPGTEQELAKLTRDVRVNTELYASLLNTSQQLRLAKASRVATAKLVDAAVVPTKPVGPRRALILGAATLAGLVFATILAMLRKSLTRGIDNQLDLARDVSLPLVAVVPHSRWQARSAHRSRQDQLPLVAEDASDEGAVESLRTFRATLDHSSRTAQNNVVLFVGPTSGVGKSFIAANFSALLARSGKRVLLIDADLHGGRLHAYFGRPRGVGLGELMLGQAKITEAIAMNVVPGLDFLSTGALRLRAGDAVAAADVRRLVEQFASSYDHVVIDTAPVLAVADALVLSNHVGLVYCVARKGMTTVAQLTECAVRFEQSGHGIDGILFNDARPTDLAYGYGSAYRTVGLQSGIAALAA